MQNRYGKGCVKCGIFVQPYKGVCEKRNGMWEVFHTNCLSPQRAQALEDAPIFRPWTDADWERVAGEPVPLPKKVVPTRSYSQPSGFHSIMNDHEDDFYQMTGMTQADFRDAVNPDEGDKW